MGEMPFTITKLKFDGKHSKLELHICRFNLCLVSDAGAIFIAGS